MSFSSYRDSVAIYLRKSRMDSDAETTDETLARHSDTLKKLAAKMELNVVGIYKEVVSGDGLFVRPEMCRLLQDVEQGRYSAVCCMAIDRLGRGSSKEAGIILETLQEHNVFIVTPDKVYNLHDDVDETSLEMQTFIARQELKSIKRRLRRGVEKSCEFGYHVAEPPYGYRRAYADKHPTLEIYEEEANVVRMVYDMYVNQGLGGHIIADTLNNMGYQPRKNDRFSRNTIRFFLQNPVYTGKIVWNRRRHLKKKSPSDKHKFVANSKDKWIVSDGIHPAIISQELFDEAQKIRLARTHPPTYTGELRNPFAGLIYCKSCGTAVQRQFSKKGGNRLLCTTTGCTRSIRAEYVERNILDFLKQALSRYETTLENHSRREHDNKAEMARTAVQGLKTKLHALSVQKSKLHDLLEQGVYSTDVFLERVRVISDKIQSAEKLLRESERKLSELEETLPTSEAVPILKELLEHYDSLSAAEKNTLLKQMISRIYYSHTDGQKRGECSLEIELKDAL